MSYEQDSLIKQSQQHTDNGLAADLDTEALHSLVGFFDVLIQMDLEQRSKERQRDESIRSQYHAD